MTATAAPEAFETARRLLAEATGCDVSQVDDQASIESFDPWDSLAHMRLILAIETETGAQIAPEKVVELMCLADVASLIDQQDGTA